jgi:hypothetical protein
MRQASPSADRGSQSMTATRVACNHRATYNHGLLALDAPIGTAVLQPGRGQAFQRQHSTQSKSFREFPHVINVNIKDADRRDGLAGEAE